MNCTAVITSNRISVVMIDASVSRLIRVCQYSICNIPVQTVRLQNGERCSLHVWLFTLLVKRVHLGYVVTAVRPRSQTSLVLERRRVAALCCLAAESNSPTYLLPGRGHAVDSVSLRWL
jgi:hypothetical protein